MLFAEKKVGGSLHLCIGHRALKSNMVNETWLLLRIDEFSSHLHGEHIFIKLDLRDRYH